MFLALKAGEDDPDVDVTFSDILVETFGTRIAARFHFTYNLDFSDPDDPDPVPIPVTITIIHETIWEKKGGEWKITELFIDIDETMDIE